MELFRDLWGNAAALWGAAFDDRARTLILATECFLWALAIMGRQILMGPNAPNYPRARTPERIALFVWMGLLYVRGIDLGLGAADGYPEGPGLLAPIATLAGMAVSYAQLWDVLRSWRPPRFWARVAEAVDAGACTRWWDRRAVAEARARARRSA